MSLLPLVQNPRLRQLITCYALFHVLISNVHSAAADPPVPVSAVVTANTGFGLKLLHLLSSQNPTANVFCSPLSISQALTLTANGAAGGTQQDILTALGLSGRPLAAINQANLDLLKGLSADQPQVSVSIANAIWADNSFTFNPQFQSLAQNYFNASAETLDFHSPSAANTMDGWVSDHTEGKVQNIIKAGQVAKSSAILTNAVYFHGDWLSAFDPRETNDAGFTSGDASQLTVPMMHQVKGFPYTETDAYQAVSIPFEGEQTSFVIILPKNPEGLPAVLQSLTTDQFTSIITTMQPERVNLKLPKFKLSYGTGLKQPLTALGMGSAFDGTADFSELGSPPTRIGDVIHKAYLEIDEKGATAAAATVVMMFALAMPTMRPPIEFNVNHPFFCAIVDNATGSLLFTGAVNDPTSGS